LDCNLPHIYTLYEPIFLLVSLCSATFLWSHDFTLSLNGTLTWAQKCSSDFISLWMAFLPEIPSLFFSERVLFIFLNGIMTCLLPQLLLEKLLFISLIGIVT